MPAKITAAMISKVMSALAKRNKGISKRRPAGYYSKIAKMRWSKTKKKSP